MMGGKSTKRKTEQDYIEIAAQRDIQWTGSFPQSTAYSTEWMCRSGHTWHAPYNSIRSGRGCPHCSGVARKTEQDYLELAQRRNFEFVGPFPANTHIKTRWRCLVCNHIWEDTYKVVLRDDRCPSCSNRRRFLTEDDYHKVASEKSMTWHGPFPSNVNSKSLWICSQGHEWNATYWQVRSYNCPTCYRGYSAEIRSMPSEKYHELAAERGFKLISDAPATARMKARWRCPVGHEWLATYSKVRYGTGCPHCSGNAPITADQYHQLAQERNLKWIGPMPAGASKKTEWECPVGHRWRTSYSHLKYHKEANCPKCYNGIRGQTQRVIESEYTNLAIERNVEFVGPYPPNNHVKTWWKCNNSHLFLTSYKALKKIANQEHNCPECGRSKPGSPHRAALTGGDYAFLAEQVGMFFLGPVPKSGIVPTQWQCQHGHIFKRAYHGMKKIRTCPHCHDYINGRKVSKQQRKLHKLLGGELNRRVGVYAIDIALEIDGINIAIEYDSAYWHRGHEDYDAARDTLILSEGYRLLRIQSNTELPTKRQLNTAIKKLTDGSPYEEITLPDWDYGHSFHNPD